MSIRPIEHGCNGEAGRAVIVSHTLYSLVSIDFDY